MCKMCMIVSKFEVDHSSYLPAFIAQNCYRNQVSTHLWGCCQCCSDLLDPAGPCSIGTALQIPNWNAFVNGRAHVIIRLCRKKIFVVMVQTRALVFPNHCKISPQQQCQYAQANTQALTFRKALMLFSKQVPRCALSACRCSSGLRSLYLSSVFVL